MISELRRNGEWKSSIFVLSGFAAKSPDWCDVAVFSFVSSRDFDRRKAEMGAEGKGLAVVMCFAFAFLFFARKPRSDEKKRKSERQAYGRACARQASARRRFFACRRSSANDWSILSP